MIFAECLPQGTGTVVIEVADVDDFPAAPAGGRGSKPFSAGKGERVGFRIAGKKAKRGDHCHVEIF